MAELKPCPFCGGEADFIGETATIKCRDCGGAFIVTSPFKSRYDVANAWNTRSSEGEWIIDRTPIDATFKCSKCGYSYIEADPQAETEYKFCPNCGAKMNGGG